MTAAAGACISLSLLVGAVKRGGSQLPLASWGRDEMTEVHCLDLGLLTARQYQR